VYENYTREMQMVFVRTGVFAITVSVNLLFWFMPLCEEFDPNPQQTDGGVLATSAMIGAIGLLFWRVADSIDHKAPEIASDPTIIGILGAGITSVLLAVALLGVPLMIELMLLVVVTMLPIIAVALLVTSLAMLVLTR
jgi:hypothetical protein